MTNIYKTTYPSEMTDTQRNFVIEMLKGMIPSKQSVIDITEEIENAVNQTRPAVQAG